MLNQINIRIRLYKIITKINLSKWHLIAIFSRKIILVKLNINCIIVNLLSLLKFLKHNGII